MAITIREVYEWHLENAQECRGSELQDQKQLHLDMAEALKEHLPSTPCRVCYGKGSYLMSDDDGYEVVPCECQYADVRR